MTTAPDQQSRAEFEACIKANFKLEDGWWCRQLPDGGYSAGNVDSAWKIWQAARALPAGMEPVGYMFDWPDEPELGHYFAEKAHDGARSQALHTAAQVLAMIDAGIPGNKLPPGWSVTEDMHIAAVKVLHRATGVDGLPQRMVDAMLAAAPQPASQERHALWSAPTCTRSPAPSRQPTASRPPHEPPQT